MKKKQFFLNYSLQCFISTLYDLVNLFYTLDYNKYKISNMYFFIVCQMIENNLLSYISETITIIVIKVDHVTTTKGGFIAVS